MEHRSFHAEVITPQVPARLSFRLEQILLLHEWYSFVQKSFRESQIKVPNKKTIKTSRFDSPTEYFKSDFWPSSIHITSGLTIKSTNHSIYMNSTQRNQHFEFNLTNKFLWIMCNPKFLIFRLSSKLWCWNMLRWEWLKWRSALNSIHQNHLGREGLRWNDGQLMTCYTKWKLRSYDNMPTYPDDPSVLFVWEIASKLFTKEMVSINLLFDCSIIRHFTQFYADISRI